MLHLRLTDKHIGTVGVVVARYVLQGILHSPVAQVGDQKSLPSKQQLHNGVCDTVSLISACIKTVLGTLHGLSAGE